MRGYLRLDQPIRYSTNTLRIDDTFVLGERMIL